MNDLPEATPRESGTADDEAVEDKFPLRPARGAVIGVISGAFIWLVILVLGFRLFSPSVLLIASLIMLVAIALTSLLKISRRTAQKNVGGARPRQASQAN